MRVLITGGMGNVGSRLAARLAERGDRVAVFDVRPEPLEDSPELRRCRALVGDIADRAGVFRVFEDGGFDSVFHLAALLSAEAEGDRDRAWRVNMEGTRNVLEAATRFGVGKVVYSSTIASFGPGVIEPVGIDAPQWPVSLYGATKVAGERLGVYYHHRFRLDYRALRIPAVVAPRGGGGGTTAFCSQLYEQAVREGRYEFYVEPTAGRPVLYIDDVVRALMGLHDAPEAGLRRRVYQVGGIAATAREMAAAVLERLPGVAFTYEPDPVRNAIVKSLPTRIDESDAARDWGWKPGYDLATMTDRMIEELQREGE